MLYWIYICVMIQVKVFKKKKDAICPHRIKMFIFKWRGKEVITIARNTKPTKGTKMECKLLKNKNGSAQ
jgi:hypothetical protein